jgi:hypothetical protein
MDRPALQRLLADLTAGRVDTIVVYKIDRLTQHRRPVIPPLAPSVVIPLQGVYTFVNPFGALARRKFRWKHRSRPRCRCQSGGK